ncbi:MAG: sulfatase [Flavobacteriaceae bacterium]
MNRLLLLISLTTGLSFLNAQTKKDQPKLNVLFIVSDDLNCDLGAYGNDQVISPNIDKLAKRGVLFGNAHNQYPWCGPSRASFMTGLYPDQTQLKKLRLYLRQVLPKVITLSQKFRKENYHAVRVGKIYHYHNPRDIGTAGHDDNYSWDQTVNPYGRDKIEEYKINTLTPKSYGGTLSWLAADGTDEEQTDGIGATETIEFLDRFAKSGENFFLAYGLYRPHTPYVAPKKYFDQYNTSEMEIPESSDAYLETLPIPAAISIREKKNQRNLDKELAKTIKEAYYATTSFVDAQVGRVLDKLKETGLDKNTIVIFTSDHGYHLGEHGHWQKRTLFNNATRVPLIVAGPGVNKNQKIMDAPVELVDIYPTLMDLVGMDAPEFVSGKSFAPLLKDSTARVRTSALTELGVNAGGKSKVQGYSIKTDRYRLTQWGEKGKQGYELYDHKYDKEELNNLSKRVDYQKIKDSLTIVINQRIANARSKPKGLGPQIKGALEWSEPKTIHSQPK